VSVNRLPANMLAKIAATDCPAHTCPSCGLFGRKVRRRERQARCTAEAGLVAWFAALRAGGGAQWAE